MLQIRDICKEYKTGALVQKALNHVSLNLRDNEFVAILGPSGSGKTTLLNIIGGLDRYDSGDLIINGVSTRKYKDRDWDSYRNHTIGFVFQSYNLIPHQTVLSNVELALTIGGISRSERKHRAEEALRKVGLGDQMHKKPSQMSGGQMQRVAIARALVNDPQILLADEPTGALDSETSIQVMDLLREVAKDRLVVMVTHNPELAEQYATRIVRVKDGQIQDDTDPYEVEEGEAIHKNFGKASMSLLTALGLSFNNLKSKLARTLLIALAGSIGITGIALIISLSNGVNAYIQDTEEQTLSEYPLEIANASFDMASFMGVQVDAMKSDAEVTEWKTVSNMLTKISSNDLSSLRKYLESGDSGMEAYARAIEYKYSLTPEIYRMEAGGYYQVNPDSTFRDMGFTAMSMFVSSSGTNSFIPFPENSSLYMDQYDIKAGRWPENENELVVILSDNGRIADLTLYVLGLKDHKQLENMIKDYMAGQTGEPDDTIGQYNYSDLLNIGFKLVHSCDYYRYDADYKVWTNKKEDQRFMTELIQNGTDLTVVGVAMPKENATAAMLSTGIYYQSSLLKTIVDYASASEIVQSQLANPDTDIISGSPFGEKTDGSFDLKDLFSVDEDALANAFQFNTDALQMDMSGIDLSGVDLSGIDFSGINLPEVDISSLTGKIKINIEAEDIAELLADLLEDYSAQVADPSEDFLKLPAAFEQYLGTEAAKTVLRENLTDIILEMSSNAITEEDIRSAVVAVMDGYALYAAENGITDLSGLSDYLATDAARTVMAEQAALIAEKMIASGIPEGSLEKLQAELQAGYGDYAKAENLPDMEKARENFEAFLKSQAVQDRVTETLRKCIDTTELEAAVKELTEDLSEQLQRELQKIMAQIMDRVAVSLRYAITDAMTSMAGSFQDALKIDGDAFAQAFKVTMTEEELQELMTAMMSTAVTTLEGNLSKMGYTDLNKPSSIIIYPRDFDSKAKVKEILNAYNAHMRETGQEEKVVSYTDIVGTLMTSVTDIINAISYVLVAFVAISLVVSSIMIGVITYISVLERKKEIGILRAIGASKHNISQVFNAETFIIGLLAGIIGVGGTELILIPGNILIHHLTGMDNISAVLPLSVGIILIGLSVILTLIGGLLPSKKAAKSDPVAALRSE